MTEQDAIPDDSNVVVVGDPQSKRKALSRLKRELSDEDLTSPGVQKLLIDEIEKAEDYLKELNRYRDDFYKADKELAIANSKLHRNLTIEILSGGTIAIGGAAVGYGQNNSTYLWFGVLLTIIGIVVKARGL